jgi:A/G-specific adenine glycosylase
MAFPEAVTLLAPLAPWFEGVRRAMPWRMEDLDAPHPDPYAVLVSEIMLQQTQVATVIPYFQRWMVRFPDLASLAAAEEDEIHGLWAGLGYYRRARSLQGAARALVAAGGWPGTLDGLLALPGLGPYTAAALGAQAFQWPTAALDGNAFRVLARLLALDGDPKAYAATLRTWLEPALAQHGPSRLTQAIMELGATLCAPTPRCASCPLQARCAAHLQGTTGSIPPVAPRARPKEAELYLLAIASPSGWLVRPPSAKGLLAGLWSWPSVTAAVAEGAAEASLPYGAVEGRAWPGWVQVYTHRRETIHPVALRLPAQTEAPAGLRWIPAADLGALPMGRRDQRLRQLLEEASSPGALGGAAWAAARELFLGNIKG